jgi:hypothetical protein
MSLTVSPTCHSLSWAALSNPTDSFKISQSANFTPDRNMDVDSDDVNWNNSCGQANLDYPGL